jgi:rSAM/selenodomain-associated transferase 2
MGVRQGKALHARDRFNNTMISIIIPVFNEEKIIAEQLASLSAVTDDDAEVIAVDGGSTDMTPGIIKAHGFVTLLKSPRKGRAFQMNHGASFAKGDIFLFLHADAMLPPEWKAEVGHAVEAGCVAGGFRIRCGKYEPLGRMQKIFAFLSGLRSHYAKYMYGDQAIFVKRNAFETVSGFPEIPIMEDYEFSRRILKIGKVYHSRLAVDVSYRRFAHGVVTATFLMLTMPSMYRLGVSPGYLAGLYRDIR